MDRRIVAVLPPLALGLALACAAVALLAGPGYRLAWWPLGTGIQTIRWAASGALAAAALGLLAALLAWRAGARRAGWTALAGLLVGLAVALPPLLLWRQAKTLPVLHDVSTDTEHPPAFVAVLPLRQGARNPVDYPPATAAAQRQGYPDIGPALLDLAPAQAFARAERAARTMGWAIVAVAPEAGRIEATDSTLLFGFKDDVVILVTARDGGSRVDMRSLSRVGGSDFGVNARRVRAYMSTLAATADR